MPPLIDRRWSSGSNGSDGEPDETSLAAHFLRSNLEPPGHKAWPGVHGPRIGGWEPPTEQIFWVELCSLSNVMC